MKLTPRTDGLLDYWGPPWQRKEAVCPVCKAPFVFLSYSWSPALKGRVPCKDCWLDPRREGRYKAWVEAHPRKETTL